MEYLLLGVTALTVTCQDIFKQKFNKRCKSGTFFFTGMISFFAMIFFLAVNGDWYYSAELLVPSFAFALSYVAATVFSVLAIYHGSLAKTSLIISCSLLIPSFYGMICLGEPVSATLILGTVLLVVSLIMTNYQKDDTDKKATLKWAVFVILSFIGNGMCSTVQKAKPIYYGEQGNNLFMVVALAMVTVIMLVSSLVSKGERDSIRPTISKGWLLALLCGVANGLTNYLVIYLNPRLPASVMFPVISAGSVVLVFIYSVLFNKEKFNIRQIIGFFVGIVSIVLLNI